jgi:signal transduction histidine kinase
VNQSGTAAWVLADLNLLLGNAIGNLRLDISEKNATIKPAVLPRYHCNPFEMTLLFQNLLQNAIKYNTSESPTIEVSTESGANGSQLRIRFTDNGIGIAEKYHEYVFEHFKRLHSSSEYMGTGLGLSLCRKIAAKHGGTVELQSEPGKGSQFTVVLPLG